VTIGIALNTSPSILTSSLKEPFYVVITARILTTPHPEKAITLAISLNPLQGLDNRSFRDIVCTTNLEKKIKINSYRILNDHWNPEDLRGVDSDWKFITIPPLDQGIFSVRHEVPRSKIEETQLEKGEKYRLSLSHMCLGTRWWTYGSLEELEGVRLRQWRPPSEERERLDTLANNGFGPELRERHVFEEGPTSTGELPNLLAMVPEGDAEFEVV
jgi:hypothetical protein